MKTAIRFANLAMTCIAARGLRLSGYARHGSLLHESPVTDYQSARTARYRAARLAKEFEHQCSSPGHIHAGTIELARMLRAASAACACAMTELRDQDSIDQRAADLARDANRWLRAALKARADDPWFRAISARSAPEPRARQTTCPTTDAATTA